ncbi:hypothetical protein INR49_000339, partial [Caranx melampygus]
LCEAHTEGREHSKTKTLLSFSSQKRHYWVKTSTRRGLQLQVKKKCENQSSFSCLFLVQSCYNLLHTQPPLIQTACLRGSMEREGMLVRSFYYGRIGSEATERLMERFGHDGSFLLRDSETMQGAYCLCVRKAPFVHTFRLTNSTEGWSLQIPGVRQQRFRTVETLIECYRRGLTPDVQMPPLTEPLDKTQLQYISFGEGTTHTCTQTHTLNATI